MSRTIPNTQQPTSPHRLSQYMFFHSPASRLSKYSPGLPVGDWQPQHLGKPHARTPRLSVCIPTSPLDANLTSGAKIMSAVHHSLLKHPTSDHDMQPADCTTAVLRCAWNFVYQRHGYHLDLASNFQPHGMLKPHLPRNATRIFFDQFPDPLATAGECGCCGALLRANERFSRNLSQLCAVQVRQP